MVEHLPSNTLCMAPKRIAGVNANFNVFWVLRYWVVVLWDASVTAARPKEEPAEEWVGWHLSQNLILATHDPTVHWWRVAFSTSFQQLFQASAPVAEKVSEIATPPVPAMPAVALDTENQQYQQSQSYEARYYEIMINYEHIISKYQQSVSELRLHHLHPFPKNLAHRVSWGLHPFHPLEHQELPRPPLNFSGITGIT